jgi:hypothetical protein
LSTVRTVETFVIQSGAVITVSGVVYTAGAAVTTTYSGQMGDFAGGYGLGTLRASDGAGTGVPNSGSPEFGLGPALPVTVVTLAVGGLIGALACLLM